MADKLPLVKNKYSAFNAPAWTIYDEAKIDQRDADQEKYNKDIEARDAEIAQLKSQLDFSRTSHELYVKDSLAFEAQLATRPEITREEAQHILNTQNTLNVSCRICESIEVKLRTIAEGIAEQEGK